MIEIIPSINVRTFEEVQERIKRVEPYVKWCHLDVTDGIFSTHKTWRNPRDLLNLETPLDIEVHLMVSEPEKIIDQWLVKSVKRLIFHIEAMKNPELIIKKCRDAGVEIGFAINPETFWETLKSYFGKADVLQVLTVHPGPSGQEVDWPQILGKITHIREVCKQCIIEVDGGINLETAKKAVGAGANLLIAGNYIFGNPDVEEAIRFLNRVD